MYGKHFASAYTGSMMAAGAHVFAVWGYIIANTVQGRVELNPRLLAALIGAGVVDIQKAIDYLAAPDPASRSKEHDGRRLIREGEYQYFVPNHEKYRSIRDEEGRREYNRQKKAEQRERERASNGVKASVKVSTDVSAHTEAEAEAEAEKITTLSGKGQKTREFNDAAKRLIEFLNKKTGKAFTPATVNLEMIAARLKEGATEQDCKSVIARKTREWLNDEKMAQYLRPATLFNRQKFAQYLGELVENPDV